MMDDRFGWPTSGKTGRTASSTAQRDVLIGAGRDARALTDALIRGASTVLVGPLGSGKTFLMQHVAEALAARSVSPVILRGATALADVEYGVVNASSDPRASELRQGTLERRVVLMVDDAQHLDSASAEAVARAVHRGQAAMLVALSEPRIPSRELDTAGHLLADLWLDGTAERLDLGGFTPEEGSRLFAEFTSNQTFDGVTRAAIIWQADGSRLLLRALADHAVDAVSRGEDPIRAIDDAPPSSKLAAALSAHIRDVDDAALQALVLVGHAPGITFGDAARFVPTTVLHHLRSAGIVQDDRSLAHRLTANRAVARAAARATGASRAEAIVREATDRMIEDGGQWWNGPLARLIAERWIRESGSAARLADVSADLIVRVLADAARLANDEGDAGSAAAYAAWAGEHASTPVLALEEDLAHLVLGAKRTSHLNLHALPSHGQRRTLTAAVTLALQFDSSPRPQTDAVVAAEFTVDSALADARDAISRMEIERADGVLRSVREHPDLDHADRIDMELLAASVSAYLGREQDMRRQLRSVEWLLRSGGRRGSAAELLAARCRDLAARTTAGVDDTDVLVQLDAERRLAVHTGDTSLALAGVASVLTLLRRGHVLEARIELLAALRRSPINGGEGQGLIVLETALGLALYGHVSEARHLMDALAPLETPSPLFAHMEHATRATIELAEGRWDDARRSAAQAWVISGRTDAVMLQTRTLHRLVVVGHPDAGAALHDLRALVSDIPSDAARMILASAEQAARSNEMTVPAALLHLRLDLCPPQLLPDLATHGSPDSAESQSTLTPRELEIAELVHRGLSNRQIANALFLSVRTVESHIYQARSKIGARSRQDLAALIAADDRDHQNFRRTWG
nr:LuxR C-terminal-related transcriptional regulator [Microbacterium sp. SGAir0570]